MKNKLSDLNNHLFEQLERLNDEDLAAETLDFESERARSIAGIAKIIIGNAELMLDAQKHFEISGAVEGEEIPDVLRTKPKSPILSLNRNRSEKLYID